MKIKLWSTIVGILIGVLLGAGVAYAATVYQNSADVPVSVEVGNVPVTYSPGLEVSPTAINFSVEPGGKSNIVPLTVRNISDEVLDGIRLELVDGVYELCLQETSKEGWNWGGTWKREFYDLNIELGDSHTFNIYLIASTDVTPGSYDLTLCVKEI